MAFIEDKSIVIPPSRLEAPAKAAWPPLFTANGHFDQRDKSTTADISEDVLGWKMQEGFAALCCCDQN